MRTEEEIKKELEGIREETKKSPTWEPENDAYYEGAETALRWALGEDVKI